MFATKSEYDRGVNTFSPEGRLFQVEYALGAIKLGSTAVGIQTTEGVVLAVEKRHGSVLMDLSSIEKVMEIDTHMGCAMAGLSADAGTLIDHARVESQHHWFLYNEKLPVESCVHSISDLALDFSDVGVSDRKKVMSRPFGVALLVAGVDDNGPQLWMADPSGMYTRYFAAAIGSAQEGAETILQEQYNKSMTMKEAEELSLVVLRQVMEDRLGVKNVDVASVLTSTGKYVRVCIYIYIYVNNKCVYVSGLMYTMTMPFR
eukprot:GHVR01150648.1.p1 GENE.GHVR01150648.1~~GHVR01150648.1.p1  ORF type:complete len:260 (+),score=75.74 GHVR01150648.1:46-825(+)